MTLDSPANWKAAEALERDENPAAKKRREEAARIEALADLLGTHERDMSQHFFRKMAGRLVAYAPRVTELLSMPAPPIHRDLQQQQTNSYSDEDSILERLHELDGERDLLHGYLRAMGSVYAPKLLDRDEANADEDDRRISQERADEKAAAGMPKGMAS